MGGDFFSYSVSLSVESSDVVAEGRVRGGGRGRGRGHNSGGEHGHENTCPHRYAHCDRHNHTSHKCWISLVNLSGIRLLILYRVCLVVVTGRNS